VRSAKIAPLGELHQGRKRVQPAGNVIREFYETARGVLKYELLTLTPNEVEAIACSFAATIKQQTYTCYACAIMPDHIHIIIRKHRDQAEAMISQLQAASRTQILDCETGSRDAAHPVWGGPGWKVFLNDPKDIRRTIQYVEQNPVKIHRPVQHWPFVKPYDGWMPGQAKISQTRNHSKPGIED